MDQTVLLAILKLSNSDWGSYYHPEEIIDKLNLESPENVLIIDYRNLISHLNNLNRKEFSSYNAPPEKIRKIQALAECTYPNRIEIIRKYKDNEQEKEGLGD